MQRLVDIVAPSNVRCALGRTTVPEMRIRAARSHTRLARTLQLARATLISDSDLRAAPLSACDITASLLLERTRCRFSCSRVSPTGPAVDEIDMTKADKNKQSLYFSNTLLEELRAEASRLERSLSWVVQQCVKRGLLELRSRPDAAGGKSKSNP